MRTFALGLLMVPAVLVICVVSLPWMIYSFGLYARGDVNGFIDTRCPLDWFLDWQERRG